MNCDLTNVLSGVSYNSIDYILCAEFYLLYTESLML